MTVEFQLHPYCSLFPAASDSEIAIMAESIRQIGLQERITLYKGKIVDGRNRFFSCLKAGVSFEPFDRYFVEYDGDTSDEGLLQFVLSKNAKRRHLRSSQKALIAARMSTRRDGDNDNPQICGLFTQVKAAEEMGVSERLVQGAARLLREAPLELIAEVECGVKTVHAALEECKPPSETRAAQDRTIQTDEPELMPEPTKKPKSSRQMPHERVLSGGYDGRKFQNNIKRMQENITRLEEMSTLFNHSFDIMGKLEEESLLNTMIGYFLDAVRKVEGKLQRTDKTDFSEVKQFVINLLADHFPDIKNDCGAESEEELDEHLRSKLIGDCQRFIREGERIQMRLKEKHTQPTEGGAA